MARAQGPKAQAFYAETRNDATKAKAMIDNYVNVVGEEAGAMMKPGRKPPCPWKLVGYMKVTYQKME
eukprot:10664364-Alexandrium_andersonii.AAC.1